MHIINACAQNVYFVSQRNILTHRYTHIRRLVHTLLIYHAFEPFFYNSYFILHYILLINLILWSNRYNLEIKRKEILWNINNVKARLFMISLNYLMTVVNSYCRYFVLLSAAFSNHEDLYVCKLQLFAITLMYTPHLRAFLFWFVIHHPIWMQFWWYHSNILMYWIIWILFI